MWLAEGHIDAATGERLRAALDQHEAPAKQNKIIGVLVTIGAVLIGGGLLLFIASQWGSSSPASRLALLFAIYALTVAGALLAGRQKLTITANGLWFLSSIAVGVNIFLVGQIFNLPLNYWQGTFLWMLATLAAGWAAPSSAQGWLAVPLGILTLGWISTPSSFAFDQAAFLWEPAGIKALLPIIGIGLVAIALLVPDTPFAWLKKPATAFGTLLVAVPLTISTFDPEIFAWIFGIDVQFLHPVIGLAALALVVIVWRRDPTSPLAMGFGSVFLLLVALLPQTSSDSSDRYTEPWLAEPFEVSSGLFWVYTAIIFGLSVGAIIAGQRFDIKALINVGFAMVSVQLFALYVGRIAGALPTSLAVIGGGLLLVGGAIFLERKRREITDEVLQEVTV